MDPSRGVILDLDGTLLDSNDAHAEAWMQAMAEAGHNPDFQDVRRRIGMGGDFLIPETLGVDPDSAAGKEISERRRKIFENRYLPHLKPFPRARDLVQRLRDEGYRVVVASSSRREELARMLDTVGISDLIDSATSASDVDNSKPEPDVLQAALRCLEMSPAEVFLIGDTPYDLQAAARLGMPVIAVRSGGWDDAGLTGAAAVYADVAELVQRFEESPLAK
jgi:HAD superfamily hydrolase (TIGR01509 family)